MKKVLALLLVSVLVLGFVACSSEPEPPAAPPEGGYVGITTLPAEVDPPADQIVWRFGHQVNYDNPWHLSGVYFADLVYEMSEGRLLIEVFPNNTLGGEMDLLNGILLGTAEMTATAGSFEVFAPTAALLEAPWAYQDEAHFQEMMASSIGQGILEDFRSAGFEPLFYNLRTPRMLTSNFPVNHPDDMVGQRIRLPNVPLQMNMWATTGASPQTIALAETFTALSQGVVDMQENPFDMIYNQSFFEVQQYANLTEHVISAIMIVVGMDQLNALPADLREIVLYAAQRAQVEADRLYFEFRDHFRDRLVESGMIMNADVDRAAFAEVMVPAIEEFLSPELWDLYQQIVALRS